MNDTQIATYGLILISNVIILWTVVYLVFKFNDWLSSKVENMEAE